MELKIGLLQYDIAWENKQANKEKIRKYADDFFSSQKIDWLILPEFCLTGFSLDSTKTEFDSSDFDFFSNLSKQYEIYISFGALANRENKIITLDRTGARISEYSKIHLFTYGNEHNYYSAGTVQNIFQINGLNILPAVCYDLRFSYLFWDNALKTDVFVIIANWPAARRLHWLTLLKARAIENQCYVIGVNRIGATDKLEYSGDSIVIDPFGNEIVNTGNSEGIFSATISGEKIKEQRRIFQVLADRRK